MFKLSYLVSQLKQGVRTLKRCSQKYGVMTYGLMTNLLKSVENVMFTSLVYFSIKL